VEGAIASLCDLTGPGPLRFDGVKNHLCVLRFAGLVPPLDRVESLISQGDRMLSSVNRLDPEGAAAFLCYKGYLLLRAGRPAEARTALTQAMDPSRALRTSRYLMSRILADLGEACRVLGDVEAAERYLDQAQDMQTRRGFQGELADTTLTYRAKLHRDTPARSRLLLRRAKQIQVSLGNHFALVRTLLLEARLARMPWMARRRRDMVVGLRDGIPALRDCPTLTRILQGWDEWACALDRPATEGQDFFWNL
jgi:tetratricopeptide (TPR) repeat protein